MKTAAALVCAALLFLTLGCDGKETSLTSTVNLAFTERDP
jgi:hypothetical protein